MATGKRFFWIKLKTNFMTSDKVDFLMSQPNGAEYVVLYQMLCMKCINTEGYLARRIGEIIIPFDAEKITRDCKYFKIDTVKQAFNLFIKLGMIYQETNGYLRIADFENLIGSETDWAAQKRNSKIKQAEIPAIEQDCGNNAESTVENFHTDIDIDIDIEKEIDSNTVCAKNEPEYIKNKIVGPEDYKKVQSEFFNLISKHNATGIKKIPISNNEWTFQTKEGRALAELLKIEKADVLIQSLKNYIRAVECNGWRTSFTFQSFCKNYIQFSPEYFNIASFMDIPKTKAERIKMCNEFMGREYRKENIQLITPCFIYHRADWFKAGMPEGEIYYQLQKQWEDEDIKNGVEYLEVNKDWDKI